MHGKSSYEIIPKIEVALRVRLVEALLIHGEPLVLQDSSIFKEKKRYWQNMATVASEIARSNDEMCIRDRGDPFQCT